MIAAPSEAPKPGLLAGMPRGRALPRALVIGLIGFLTLVDLFAAQAILPALVAHYGVSPAEMGLAVNAGTLGMAFSGLAVSLLGDRIDQRRGIAWSLALLAIPTALLAVAPGLTAFAVLRIVQGVFMAAAFTLCMAYLADRAGPRDTAAALAAYVTGVVASNLIGRLVSGTVNDVAGLEANFVVFAGLNLAGAVLVALTLSPAMKVDPKNRVKQAPLAALAMHLADRRLSAAFGIGFLILFVFLGCFTYVNFELAAPPIALAPAWLGVAYLVFLPAMVTTPMAGRVAARFGAKGTMAIAFGLCLAALPLLALPLLAPVLLGLAMMGVGTFLAQAAATGYVGRTAASDRAAASGLYLSSYYLGGLAGAFVLGQVHAAAGWGATLVVLGAALLLALLLSRRLVEAR